MSLRLGALCRFENPSDEAGRALIRQFVLVREADRMGYDDIWLAERHGDAHRPSGAITALLGHLAGVTSKARIGAILQPAGRDAAQLAEDLATVELLSRGRLALAADARGPSCGPTLAALGAVQRLLGSAAAELVPRPAGAALPTWILGDRGEAVQAAATRGLGLWLPHQFAHDTVAEYLRLYRSTARDAGSAAEPRLMLTRHVCPAATREDALAIARPYLEALGRPDETEALLAQSLVGSHAEVAAQIKRLEQELGLHGLAVVPMSANFDTAKHILADMVDEVRPLLDD
jgi:alkanesulfonate monooxygenase SsuD/methylene tetrahydromethanopterin reductase-like flavin-dependent oxidoreductase (luciferase family)